MRRSLFWALAAAALPAPAQDEIVWTRNLSRAMADAKDSGKPLFIVFR